MIKCSNCFFFVEDKNDKGTCHKNPPTVLLINTNGTNKTITLTVFPMISQTEWCGAFLPKCNDGTIHICELTGETPEVK